MPQMFLVLLETSGNQRFIFATNMLREHVGASELIYRAGRQWVLDAMKDVTGLQIWDDEPEKLVENLCSEERNPCVKDESLAEVIVAVSGRALLLTRTEKIAQGLVTAVTTRALKEAPGLDCCGAVVPFEWDSQSIHDVITEAHARFDLAHGQLPGPALRFPRLPIVAPCRTSGLPAADLAELLDERPFPLSRVSKVKWDIADDAFKRKRQELGIDKVDLRMPKNISDLERLVPNLDWLAVVHADGNGVGQMLLNFKYLCGAAAIADIAQSNAHYVDALRRFSLALHQCGLAACRYALEKLADRTSKEKIVALVPLIAGGDDLTVVCDGKIALTFARDYLKSFEEETARADLHEGIIREIAGNANSGYPSLTACAGIAIVKPHFPFHAAYDLAEDLCQSAKVVKEVVKTSEGATIPCSALDFHVLYDSSAFALDPIREKLWADGGGTRLIGQPYIITPVERLQQTRDIGWVKRHHWDRLVERVRALIAPSGDDPARRALPNSQAHELRAGLFLGRAVADARYNLIKHRYNRAQKEGWPAVSVFEGENDSLFWSEDQLQVTGLLDAMDAAEFLPKEVQP